MQARPRHRSRRAGVAVSSFVRLAVPVIAVALGGCGGSGSSSGGPNARRFTTEPQHHIAAVVDNLQALSRSGDATGICRDIFTAREAATIARNSGVTCEQQVKVELVQPDATYAVNAIRPHPNWALVNLTEGNGRHTGLFMILAGSAWRIDSIFPVR